MLGMAGKNLCPHTLSDNSVGTCASFLSNVQEAEEMHSCLKHTLPEQILRRNPSTEDKQTFLPDARKNTINHKQRML